MVDACAIFFRSFACAHARFTCPTPLRMPPTRSNWRGPVWVNANAMLAYGLNSYGFKDDALEVGRRVVSTLAQDLVKTGTWHECYHGDTGAGLAAGGFLSWNTLGAVLLQHLRRDADPFDLNAVRGIGNKAIHTSAF